MLGRFRGCALLLVVLGVGAWVLPLFGRQFSLVRSLSEDLGMAPAALGGLLVAAALLMFVGTSLVERADGRRTDLPGPLYSRTSASPEVVQIVASYLDEVSRRLRSGERLEAIASSVASRSGLAEREVLKALTTLGPAARQQEMEGGLPASSPPGRRH